mgnify:CR=1 FL=1
MTLACLICAVMLVPAQDLPESIRLNQMMQNHPPQDLKESDAARLLSLPVLKMPEYYKINKVTLPYMVDNSTQPYFRPIGWQQGYECGQSAGIAYNFTYELDRLRNVPASQLENQIVTHFSWDFLNNGEQYVGASAFDGWEIVRAAGSPNAVDYGGSISWGDHTRWMSGYSTYYAAMNNRLNSAYQLNVSTEEGINTLKTWLYDHLEGSPVGGVCNLYMGYFSPSETLPAGTPEAGMAVKTSTSGSGHTWTIVGYNDSVRWDYNNDGQYTNHIDINGDGMVNVKDWEIGGVKFANGYSGTGWGNGGFCYLMYKCLADAYGSGGIWNNTVFVLKIKEHCDPQLTYKVTLKHTCRNMIRVRAGIALNTSATQPEYYLDFPHFNYQGGPLFMQGGTTEADKTIEFGLDCTPLLSYLPSGQQARFFLDIYEKDPSGTHSGEVVNFSVISYAPGFNETAYPSTNIPISNNDTSRLSLLKTITFSKPSVVNTSLPEASLGEDYSVQLNATGGYSPYRWDLDWRATESNASATFPTSSASTLVFSNNGYAVQNLAFEFPYCGKRYSQIFVSPDGFIKFDNGLYTWPFLIDADLLYKSTCMISPFLADFSFYSGDNVWFEGDAQSATVRWKMSLSGQSATDANFALRIYPSGKIEFYYGSISITAGTKWLAGLSAGDNRNYQFTAASNSFTTNSSAFFTTLQPPVFPRGLELSEDGLISGNCPDEHHNTLLPIRVTDNNNIWSTSYLAFSTKGILMTYTLDAGGDTIVQAGETVKLNMKLKNIGSSPIAASTMLVTSQDSLATMTDSTESVSLLAAGDSVILDTAFVFIASPDATEGQIIHLDAAVFNAVDTFRNELRIKVHSFILEAGNTTLADGNNNQLEPGETSALIIGLLNSGGATARNINVTLSCADPYISVTSGQAYMDSLSAGSTSNMFFIISASPALPAQRIIVFNLGITADGNYYNHDFVVLVIGQYGETFESGDFTAYPWTLSGNVPWYVQDSVVYAGTEAAKSGNINDNQTSVMSISANVLADGQIRFFRKVSCEADNTNHNYDYLAFYIDGIEKERWDGEKNWAEAVYNVSAGNRTFRWSYVKDYSVSTGSDCAWLDNIVFPPMGDDDPDLEISPLSLFEQVDFNDADTQAVSLNNNGSGLILYNSEIQYIASPPGANWCRPLFYAGSLDPGSSFSLDILFDAGGLAVGTYNCNLIIQSNFLSQTIIPVTMEVVSTAGTAENGSSRQISAAPNPFSGNTRLTFYAEAGKESLIEVFDISGRKIRTLFSGELPADGVYTLEWDGLNEQGATAHAGLYLVKFSNGDSQHVIRLVRSL